MQVASAKPRAVRRLIRKYGRTLMTKQPLAFVMMFFAFFSADFRGQERLLEVCIRNQEVCL